MATACLWRDGEVLAESATRGRSTAAQRLLADVDHLMRDGRRRAVRAGRDRRRHRPGHLHRPSDRPGVGPRARLRPVACRSTASARSTPCSAGDGVDVACVDARRGEVFCKGAGIELCAIAPERAGRAAAARHRRWPATAPSATASCWAGAVIARRRLAAARPVGPPPRGAAPSCWAAPEPLYVRAPDADRVARREGRLMMTAVDVRPLRPVRPRRDRADRAPRLPDARGRGRCSPASWPSRAASAWAPSRARTCSAT